MKHRNKMHDFRPFPYPYLVEATDKYYNVPNPHGKKEVKMKNRWRFNSHPNKKLRILITTFWDYPAVGGLQNYIATLKNAMEKLGHHVDVISPNLFPKEVVAPLKKNILKETEQFYMERYGCISKSILQQNARLACFEIMLRNMDLEKYDIFHAQDRFTANVLIRINRRYQKPLLFTPHGFMTHRRLQFNQIEKGSVEEAYFLSMDQQATQCVDQIIILCEVFRPILKKLGVPDNKMTTIYTGIDFPNEETQKRNKSPDDKVIITCISRLRPRKGHLYLLEAIALLKEETKNVDVWIVGDGEMRESLEEQVKALQLENVFFLGSRNDIPKLLNMTDIFVLPTTSDTLPISIIEAMFAGKAIITTNCGGILEIIQDDETGLIVEQKSSQDLAEKISRLIQNDSFREILANNAQTFANTHLTSALMAKKMEEVYQSFQYQGDDEHAL